MGQHLSKIIIVGLLIIIVAVPLLLQPSEQPAEAKATGPMPRLVVLTPHNEQIRYEFARAFNEHRAEQNKPAVFFDWRTLGGTSDLRKLVLSELAEAIRSGNPEEGNYDLFFGGGEYEHNRKLKGGTEAEDPQGETVRLSASIPINIPDEVLEAAFPEQDIAGEALYDPELYWVGTALSSFGIIYNRDVLNVIDVETPHTWADLRDHHYHSWIALADASHSGSAGAAYDAILRRTGWAEGWRLLRDIYANARYFTSSASKVPVDVSQGEAAAGMCIDFYGRFQAGAIAEDRLEYVDPAGMTAVTSDPISILRGAPSIKPDAIEPGLAEEFVIWTLSQQAQRLWQREVRPGVAGFPQKFALRRLPIRRDVYTPQERRNWVDRNVDPWEVAKPFPAGMPSFYGAVAPVSQAIALDIHTLLQEARSALVAAEKANHPKLAEMRELFYAMPAELTLDWPDAALANNWQDIIESENHPRHDEVADILGDMAGYFFTELGDNDKKLAARLRWTKFFSTNYQKVIDLARQ